MMKKSGVGSTGRAVYKHDDIRRALMRISYEIVEKNRAVDDIMLIGIHTRGVFLAQRLAHNIHKITGEQVTSASLDVTCFRDDIDSYNEADAKKCLTVSGSDSSYFPRIDGKKIVLVDDVLYSGRTVRAALDAVQQYGRASVIQLAVLVDRGHRELPIRPDYVGKNLPTSHTEQVHVCVSEYDECDDGVWIISSVP